MKNFLFVAFWVIAKTVSGQSLTGTWQLTDHKTCFQAEMKESSTEKELETMMGSNSNSSVAQLIIFKKDGSGEEGVFSVGQKKGSNRSPFQYKLSGNELLFTDKRSGMITQRLVIDEFTDTSLKVHDAVKDCETKAFVRVK